MDIPIEELLKRLLTQMQQDTALSDEEKRTLRRELEKMLKEEDFGNEEK